MKADSPQPGIVRIGSKAAEASLVSKTDPVYPPKAVAARIQGVVEFTVTVGPEGKVEKIQLVSGHPIMVEAAKEAVQKWVYHPATVDGTAISFVTQVIVPFRLDDLPEPLLADPPLFPR
jgi:protein TonB